MSEKFFDQRELAQRWKLSPRTLERWRWIGQGPTFLKLGRRVVYRENDVVAFEANSVHFIADLDNAPAPQGGDAA